METMRKRTILTYLMEALVAGLIIGAPVWVSWLLYLHTDRALRF